MSPGGEGWAGVLTYLALASGRWCYAKSTLCWNLQRCHTKRVLFSIEKIAESHVTFQRLEEKTVDLQTLTGGMCKNTHFLWGKKPEPVRNSPCNCEFRNWITCKKTNSWGRLENTLHVELRMGKQHEIFPPMELRVSKLVWWSHFCPIGMINIPYHENVKNTMPYQGPIWAVDLVSLS